MAFDLVVLGCTGGPKENHLSAYLLCAQGRKEWITLDAGVLLGALEKAFEKGAFKEELFSDPTLTPLGEFFLHHIKAYLISHAHIDHIAGLIANSTADISKPIFGIDSTIDHLRDCIFNGHIWPNYGNEGVEPIGKYQYVRLPLASKRGIQNTPYYVEAFQLNHPKEYASTAFLVEYQDQYVLYCGDSSSDEQEEERRLEKIWHRIAPLIREKKLRAILLECSYPSLHAHKTVFGHLDTLSFMHEMCQLEHIAHSSLRGLKVVVTHRKESFRTRMDLPRMIEEELQAANHLGLQLIFPSQGERIIL